MDQVRRDSRMRALDLHALANGYRSKMVVELDPARRAQLGSMSEYWEGKAKEAEDEGPLRNRSPGAPGSK
jgi:hypothetical protein